MHSGRKEEPYRCATCFVTVIFFTLTKEGLNVMPTQQSGN
jgi:hypothetical protein